MLLLLTALLMFAFPQVETAPTLWHIIWSIIIPIVAGLYEVIVRIIPTVKNYSVIGKIIEILLWLSNFFNNKKK